MTNLKSWGGESVLDYPGRTNGITEYFKKEVGKSGLEEETKHKQRLFYEFVFFFLIPRVSDIICISPTYLNTFLPRSIMLL